jgi:hypothetical protein
MRIEEFLMKYRQVDRIVGMKVIFESANIHLLEFQRMSNSFQTKKHFELHRSKLIICVRTIIGSLTPVVFEEGMFQLNI